MRPEVTQRIEQIRRGEVPKGYRETKDGTYPADWNAMKINRWLSLKKRPVTLQDDKIYKLVTVRRGFGGVNSRGQYQGKDVLVKSYFEIRQGDFLVSKRQIAHGACGVVPENLDHAVVSNEYNVFIPQGETNTEMFNLMMQLPHYKRLFYIMSDGVHIEKLLFKTTDWMRRDLAMPPIAEQQKITKILTTQDKLIELKEKQLAEKHRQKKHLMQQLLTPIRRLAGYNDKWKQEKLLDFCKFIGGGTPDTNRADFWTGDIPWVSSSDIEMDSFTTIAIHRYINAKAVQASATKVCPAGSIMIVSRVGVGKIAIAPFDLCTSQDFTTIIQNKHNNTFLLYSLYWLLKQKVYQVQGSAIKGIPANEIKQLMLKIPAPNEQIAIANILSTADREIELLQADINAEKQKKKALMQLLLTGIVRVKT